MATREEESPRQVKKKRKSRDCQMVAAPEHFRCVRGGGKKGTEAGPLEVQGGNGGSWGL